MMSAKITDTITRLVADFIVEGASSATAINTGLCADFASALVECLPGDPLPHIIGTQDLLAEAPAGLGIWEGVRPPPGLTWSDLLALGENDEFAHTWVIAGRRHYDAETPFGVESPFDLPCIRHALHEVMEMKRPEMLQGVAPHAWWSETQAVRSAREGHMNEGVVTFQVT